MRCRSLLLPTLSLILAGVAVPLAAMHPNQPLGFDPERSYQVTPQQIDQVDLYSGRLTAAIPLGPFTLVYNSNVWRYSADSDGSIIAQPDRQTTAGLGWHLGWGELYEPGHWYNPDSGRFLYVSEDGGRHYFFSTLHYDDGGGQDNVYYTRDGGYLRLKIDPVNRCWAEIELPNGITRRFGRSSCGPQTAFVWTHTWNRFGSLADPDLMVSYNADDTLRTVTDRYGRTHYVHLTGVYPWINRTITRIDLQSVGGQRAVVTLEYDPRNLDVSCKDTSPTTLARITVPHLKRIALPDGSAYSMVDGGLQYVNTCGSIPDSPGALTGLVLPTGGKLEWEYQKYVFPPGESNSVFNTAAGVKVRRVLNADHGELGRWTYTSTSIGAVGGNDPEMRTEVVVSPEGDCTRHFFNALYWVAPNPTPKGWESGLPFTYTESSGGRYLSNQTWSGNDASGHCAGTKLRSTYVRFRKDTLPGTNQNRNEWLESNRQLEASRVVYHDDGNRYIDNENSNFDGYGHFRTTVATGNLYTVSAPIERRETRVGFYRSTGTYPGGFAQIPPTAPWVLGVHDSIEVQEDGAEGSTVARTELLFDDSTGALTCARRLASGTSRSTVDVVTRFLYDARGLVTDVKLYGGDLDPLPTVQSLFCSVGGGDPVYWSRRTYQNGALKSERPLLPNGANGPFLSYDVDLDPSTGLVLAARSSAGYEVSYGYDVSGRLISVVPQDGAEVATVYTLPTATTPARISTTVLSQGGGSVLGQSEVELDGFGAVKLERTLMPDASWSERAYLYNARGWLKAISEPGNTGTWTQFLGFDPFGRASIVRPPEGSSHDLLLSYLGDRRVVRQASVATSLMGSETYFSTTWEKDSFGRLRLVTEPSGPASANTSTSYGYDVGGKMTRITSGPQTQHQFRVFMYDNRGFMLGENHPETAAVTYSEFDAAGHAHRRHDGQHDLGFSYDFLGRQTEVRDRGAGNRLLKEFVYDGATGFGAGRLWKGVRYNYMDLPWTPTSTDLVKVTDVYSYGAVGARVSQQDTMVQWPDVAETFRQWSSYDDLGNLGSRTYPRLVSPISAGTASTSRTVSFQYDTGRLASVPGFIEAVHYHPSGLWSRIEHANGVDRLQDHDATTHTRPGRIYTVGVQPSSSNYDSGVFAYDGSGNIEGMGSDRFRYDGVGRLAESWLWSGVSQSYGYDRFGNLTQRVTDGSPVTWSVDPLTNRLTDGVYDGSGNLLQHQNHSFEYDALDSLTRQAYMLYAYDATDERILSIPNDPQRTVYFTFRDTAHRRLSTVLFTGGSYQRQRDWVYAGNRLVASVTPAGGQLHYHSDHLGTPRVFTDNNGNVAGQQFILPFGEELFGPFMQDNIKLAGHERDFSLDTDYMHARHYSQHIARFLSVDPLRGRPGEPQSLNRYAYVLGNPINFYDPDGRTEDVGDGKPTAETTSPIDVGAGETITVTATMPPPRVKRPSPPPPPPPYAPGAGGGVSGGVGDGRVTGGIPGGGTNPPGEEAPETPETPEEKEQEEDPCGTQFTLTGGIRGQAMLGPAGVAGDLGLSWPPLTANGNGMAGLGFQFPPVSGSGFVGGTVSNGTVAGWGWGGTIFITGLQGIGVTLIRADSGAVSLTVSGTVGTPSAGLLVGRTYSASSGTDGGFLEPTECPQ